MMDKVIFYFLFFTVIREGLCGFTSGAPCSERNTAYLQKNSCQMPSDSVECIDITSMDKKAKIMLPYQVVTATTLYADHMDLRRVPESILPLLPQLHFIDFSGNRIRRISRDAFLSLRLHTLLLEGNRVVIPKKTPLLNAPSTKTLMLSNNKIKALRNHTFSQLGSLTVLYLDGNRLVRVSPEVFKPLKYLKYLHLGNNRLKILPNIVLPAPKAVVIVKGNLFNRTEVIKR